MVTRTGARYRPTSVPFRALGPALLCLFAGLAWSPGQAQQVLVERFSPPPGTSRVPAAPGTFAHYLRQLTLKPTGTPVLLHNGRPKSRQDVHVAVLDIPVGTRDLQQCADAVIRLRAEHLHRQGRHKDIRFHFTNGFLAEWDRWRLGERIAVSGNTVRWVAGGDRNDRPENLRAYLDQVFIYAGTRSLHQGTTTGRWIDRGGRGCVHTRWFTGPCRAGGGRGAGQGWSSLHDARAELHACAGHPRPERAGGRRMV